MKHLIRATGCRSQKRQFLSYDHAFGNIGIQKMESLEPYACPHCKRWHLRTKKKYKLVKLKHKAFHP